MGGVLLEPGVVHFLFVSLWGFPLRRSGQGGRLG